MRKKDIVIGTLTAKMDCFAVLATVTKKSFPQKELAAVKKVLIDQNNDSEEF